MGRIFSTLKVGISTVEGIQCCGGEGVLIFVLLGIPSARCRVLSTVKRHKQQILLPVMLMGSLDQFEHVLGGSMDGCT